MKVFAAAILLVTVVALASTAVVQAHAIAKPEAEIAAIGNNPNNGFTMQTGYEGYLLSPQKVKGNHWVGISKINFIKSLLVPVASFFLAYGFKALTFALHLLFAVFLGVAATTAVCSYTPLCTISLNTTGFPFNKGQIVRQELARLAEAYMTPENVDLASRFLHSAFDKYSMGSLQQNEIEGSEPDVAEINQESESEQ